MTPCKTHHCRGEVTDPDHEGNCDPCFFAFEQWDEELYDDLDDEEEPDE